MTDIQIAKDLLSIQAVFFRPDEPFVWASGIKSPVYCDNRLTLSCPEVRTDIETGLAELVGTYYPEAEILMGTSTAGIAHAGASSRLFGASAKCCTLLWNSTAVAIANTSLVRLTVPC